MDSDSKASNKSSRRSIKKKVSFSLTAVNTFEEIAKIRKIREEKLDYFIMNKKQTNEFISSLKRKKLSVPKSLNENIITQSSNEPWSTNKEINKKNPPNKKELFPSKYFLTDEDNEDLYKFNENTEKNNTGNKTNINNLNPEVSVSFKNAGQKTNESKKKTIEENIPKLIDKLSDIITMKNNSKKKLLFKKNVMEKIQKFVDSKIDNYINYEKNDTNYANYVEVKKKFFIQKIFFNELINNAKQQKYKKLLHQRNKEEAKKFYIYSLYKKKTLVFHALKTYAIKQKIWIQSIQAGLKKELVWSCIDSWKLYVNYKKIKRFLKLRKTKNIFDALRNNKKLSIDLLKQGKKMCLIFEYRHFFNNTRKKILCEKAKDINNKLVAEFRRESLLKNLFNTLKEYHRMRLEKTNKYKLLFSTKYEDKEFINIRVGSKETFGLNGIISTKKIQSKMNVI